ncbi:Hypothetical protein NTJ_13029 [Nesidiocoris tenuis]|uniref:Uncharacterized protein n=1 Tax=Nesidiocoris tenuis TaxID=355587 RepID=A0ABN7B736_9HEMI|nr:Hypothetical protein NTJ_13028 [Nesidiocoris tenuis]BET00213.1 Hypothetical protein NTJ_13029 [Nesidiocoris tenuis]
MRRERESGSRSVPIDSIVPLAGAAPRTKSGDKSSQHAREETRFPGVCWTGGRPGDAAGRTSMDRQETSSLLYS